MIKIKATLILCLSLFVLSRVSAQGELDVLRYTTTGIYGSARYEGMAGAFGGLGADFSAIQINPASLGRFSSSKASISFNEAFIGNRSLYNGTGMDSKDNKFALSQLGVIITSDISHSGNGRRYSQITLGYTRLKNFANTRSYKGQNFYSLLDVFANAGAGVPTSDVFSSQYGRPFTTAIAYNVYALDYDPSTGLYHSQLTMGDMYHNSTIQTLGGMGEYHIGYSENYNNVLYYGASLGIRRIKYTKNIDHTERLLETSGTDLRSFNYTYKQVSKGTGVNLKLGLLYLPINNLRIGLAFESSTTSTMKDSWSANMTAKHTYGSKKRNPSFAPNGFFKYRIKTPMKLRASFAYTFAMRGAIDVEFEWVNLPAGKIKPSRENIQLGNPYEFNFENKNIKNDYRSLFNTRIGVEYMIINNFFIRGGIAILPQPYRDGTTYPVEYVTNPNMIYALGIGWENRFLSINLGYQLFQRHSDYYAFDATKIENRTQFKTNSNNIVLTIAYKWF